jgi:hypothetical protein
MVDALNAGVVLNKAWESLTSWTDCFDSYEELKIQLSKILDVVKSPKSAEKSYKLTSKACTDLRQCCSKATSYSKDYFKFDLQSEVTEAVGNGVSHIDKEKLEKLLSKLNESMTKQLERMLWGDLVKSAAQTAHMIGALVNTYLLIRDSKQYRTSPTLQQATVRINENLEKARNFYQTADDQINRIENTPNAHPTSYTLGQIALNLDRARFESGCARKELDIILREISQKIRTLSSNRTSHGVNIGLSLLSGAVTLVQFAVTPSFLLSTTAKALFAVNGGLHAVNTIGHSIGFHWSHKEIHKMEELHHEMNILEVAMEDLFKRINYGVEKLERIKQRYEMAPDPTLVV